MNNITYYTLMIFGCYIAFTLICNLLSALLQHLTQRGQHEKANKRY